MNVPGQIREGLLKSLRSISFYSGMSVKEFKIRNMFLWMAPGETSEEKESGWKKSKVFHLLENIKKIITEFYKFIKAILLNIVFCQEFSLCLILLIEW